MLPLDHPDRIQITFDDRRLVANAGLLLPVTLAQHLGLRELVDHHLDLGNAPGRANAGDKMLTLVASALAGGGNMADDDFAVSAGWGHFGSGEVVMPGQGRVVEREYTDDERTAVADSIPTLGDTTIDVYLNDRAYWCNLPTAVWNYQLGGYQVLKKWLSYRESKVLGRQLQPEEVQHFTDTVRRIGAIMQLVAAE